MFDKKKVFTHFFLLTKVLSAGKIPGEGLQVPGGDDGEDHN